MNNAIRNYTAVRQLIPSQMLRRTMDPSLLFNMERVRISYSLLTHFNAKIGCVHGIRTTSLELSDDVPNAAGALGMY